jgi:hypothetical protein
MYSHNGPRTIAHRDVEYESLKKYGLVVARLVCFVFRCFEGWECRYVMKLTPAQEQACRRLKKVLVGHQRTGAEDDDLWQELDDNELEDVDGDEEEEEFDELEGNADESVELQPDLIENPVQRCVLDLLISLFSHLPSGADDKFYSPIVRFVVLLSLKQNGQWLAGRRITQLFAALLFCGREVLMAVLHGEIVRSPNMRYSE